MEKKRESQKMAAFNLGVAEAVNTKKHARDPFHVSHNPKGALLKIQKSLSLLGF